MVVADVNSQRCCFRVRLIINYLYATLRLMNRGFLISIILLVAAMPVYAGVVINEVAWMGTSVSWQDEWIELYSDRDQILDGLVLITADGDTNIKLKNSISAGSYYLIERTNDDTVPGITADLISSFGSGGLDNDAEILILKDSSGNEIDRVDGSGAWVIGGNNKTKETLQKTASGWTTALGTPKASNGYETFPSQPTPTATPTPEPSILPTPEPISTPIPTQSQFVLPTPEQTPAPSPTLLPDPTATALSPTPTSQPTVVATPTSTQSSPLYVQSASTNTSDESKGDQKKIKPKKSAASQKESKNEIASVSSPTSNSTPQFFGEYLWLVIGLGVGILAGAAFLFAKRYFP